MGIWLFAASALAEPLWVEADAVGEVEAAVAALWPGGPLEVLPRPARVEGEGLLWVGGALVWIHDGRAWTAEAPDAESAVLVARSWLRQASSAEPAPPAPLPAPEPELPPVPEPAREAPSWAVIAGARITDGVDGVRVGAAGALGRWTADASLFVSTTYTSRPSPLEGLLGDVGRTTLEPRDQVSFAGTASVAPVPYGPEGVRGGVAGTAGLVVAQQVRRTFVDGDVEEDATSTIGVAGLLGVTAGWWPTARVGLRAALLDRAALRAIPEVGTRLRQDLVVHADVLVRVR